MHQVELEFRCIGALCERSQNIVIFAYDVSATVTVRYPSATPIIRHRHHPKHPSTKKAVIWCVAPDGHNLLSQEILVQSDQ